MLDLQMARLSSCGLDVDDRERYGAHERSLALSIEETRKAWARGRRLLPHSSAQVRESAAGDSQEGKP